MDICVYIPIYNGKRYLKKTLEGLKAQTHPITEICLIDDASTDGLDDWVEEHQDGSFRYIKLEKRSGIGAARNYALNDCKTDLIAFCDVDCVPEKEWLKILVDEMQRYDAEGVGGQLVERLSTRTTDLWRAEHLQQTKNIKEREVSFLPGCNTLYKKQFLIEIGGFSRDCVYHHEDTELGKQIRFHGGKLMFIPQAITHHAKYDTVYSVMRSMWGFRHSKPILSKRELIYDIFRSDIHALKLFTKDLFSGKFRLLGLDILCYAYQVYFSFKSFRLKTTGF